jgi:hypothetical protein
MEKKQQSKEKGRNRDTATTKRGGNVCFYERSPRRRRASWMSLAVGESQNVSVRGKKGNRSETWGRRKLTLDSNTLGVNSGKVGVLKEGDEVSLCRLLESHDGRRLETEVRLEVLGNLADQSLEGEFADEELGRLLVTTDFAEGDGSRAVPLINHTTLDVNNDNSNNNEC